MARRILAFVLFAAAIAGFSYGCAGMRESTRDYLGSQQVIDPGPDGKVGTADDQVTTEPSVAQKALDQAAPLGISMGFGLWVAIGQVALGAVAQIVDMTLGPRQKVVPQPP